MDAPRCHLAEERPVKDKPLKNRDVSQAPPYSFAAGMGVAPLWGGQTMTDYRERIYAARHAIYATELAQHRENADGRLIDAASIKMAENVVRRADQIAGA